MLYWIGANIVLIIHFAFIVFVLGGGLLAIRWRWIIFLHLPAMVWGILVEYMGWICPLTPLENELRHAGGLDGYSGGFIQHYLLPVIYPENLTRDIQIIMGTIVIVVNVVVYSWLIHKYLQSKHKSIQNR